MSLLRKPNLTLLSTCLTGLKNQTGQSLEFLSDISLTMKNQLASHHFCKNGCHSNLATILIFVICVAWLENRPQYLVWQGVSIGIGLSICWHIINIVLSFFT